MATNSTNSSGLPFPTSQKERTIFFRTADKGGIGKGHTLSINPEDLTISEPSRVSVQQTLGAAWVDNFGPGLRTITISGTTGWRSKNGGPDWEAEFKSLYDEAFANWHLLRETQIKAGLDPNDIKMEFVDTLDGITVYVVPQNFVLKRSKARPLLVQYNISMCVESEISKEVNDGAPPLPDLKKTDESFLGSLNSLAESIEKFSTEMSNHAGSYAAALAPIQDYLHASNRVMKAVQSSMASGDAVFYATVGVAQQVAHAGRNMFATLAAVAEFPNRVISYFKGVMAIFQNLVCLFSNGFKRALTMQNYGEFYGASNCSSTTGGNPASPLAGMNGLSMINYQTMATNPINVTDAAKVANDTLRATDPALAPYSLATLSALAQTISGGITVSI